MNYEKENALKKHSKELQELKEEQYLKIDGLKQDHQKELEDIKALYKSQIRQLCDTHLTERSNLEKRITALQSQLTDAINNVIFTEQSITTTKMLESIPSERESELSSSLSQNGQSLIDAVELASN